MLIDPSKLDREIAILASTETQTDRGQVIAVWATVATTYAGMMELRTVDAARAGQRDTYTMARLLIRWRSDISTAHRVEMGDKLYSILAVDEPDRRNAMILTIEEVTR